MVILLVSHPYLYGICVYTGRGSEIRMKSINEERDKRRENIVIFLKVYGQIER